MLLQLALILATLLPAPAGSGGKVFLSQQEALALAFPKATVEKSTHYLDEDQRKQAAALAGVPIPKGVVRAYTARDAEGELVGTAYFDRHKVRTLPEVLMIVVGPDHKVKRIEVLAFSEPLDYLPKAKWYGQFTGKGLGPELRIKKQIRNAAGATLTARATTEAVRRMLALHQVVQGPPQPEPKPEPEDGTPAKSTP